MSDDLVDLLVSVAAAECGFTVEEVRVDKRKYGFSAARHAVWLVLLERGWTMARIGAAFGRDHSTVSNGLKRAEARVHAERSYWDLVNVLRRAARGRFELGGIDVRAGASLYAMDQEIAVAEALRDELIDKLAALRALRQQVAALMGEFSNPVPLRVRRAG